MELAEQILALAKKYEQHTAANLSELIRIPSVSLNEGAAALALKRQLEAAGVDAVEIDGLGNVIGRMGKGPRSLAFDAHLDTVDVGNPGNWSFDPFSGEIRDGHVLGRGAADQKGGAAAFVTAARILKELGFGRDLTLYFVGSVIEEDCDGLCWKYIVEESGLRPDLVICTEPTDGNITRGQRGRMEMAVTFRGVSCHGSAPERGQNAIFMAAEACLGIRALNERLANDAFLGKGTATVTDFSSAGPSLCAVADHARLHIDRRLTWGETKESAVAEIEAIVADMPATVEVLEYAETAYTGLRYGMEKYYPTWKIPEDHPAIATGVAAYAELFGRKPRVDRWTFSTNGVTINGLYGIPVIGFGPGAEAQAHAPDEKVPVADLVTASAFYAMYACRMQAPRPGGP